MAYPAVGFEQVTVIGNFGIYTTYDTYGFDQYELTMGIRIKALTGIDPTREDADYCLSGIVDNEMTFADQNAFILNYMSKYVSN